MDRGGTFSILRTGDTSAALAVSYSMGGSADGSDYSPALTGVATIAAGASSVEITITPVDDSLVEVAEDLTLTLVDTANYDLAANASSATVTIADNDTALADFNLRVSEIWPGNSVGDDLTADWFEVTNIGTEAWKGGVAPALYYDDDSKDPATADLIDGIAQIDPGESAVVVIGNADDAKTFADVWGSVIDLTGVAVGYTDGAGLGAKGDGVSLFVGLPAAGAVPADYASYPAGSVGQSYDVDLAAFSVAGQNRAVATAPNGDGQAAVGSPGNGAPIVMEPTLISAVQGSGAASPLVGQTVTIEAIVVADFQNGAAGANGDLDGFFVQEEDLDADADALTSEGIFIYDGNDPSVDVAIGDQVRITGTVTEYSNLTELSKVTVEVLSSAHELPAAAAVTLPVASETALEQYEGMRVTFDQELTVTEHYNLARYGEVVLSSGGRLYQPTQIVEPGDAAIAQQAANDLNRLILDDGLTVQNPDPVLYPAPRLSAGNTLRGGDTVQDLTGVLHYAYGEYRVQPTATPDWQSNNPRPAEVPDVGGNIKVASFNVLNYFTTLNDGDKTGPNGDLDPRGANTAEELTRQTDKLVAALLESNADVFGLMEIENDAGATLQSLVDALNAVAGPDTYDYIDTAFVGTDAITVAVIYNATTVTPQGAAVILENTDFVDPNNTGEQRNRPAVAQTFKVIDGANEDVGESFTVVVNHFKSKGASGLNAGDDSNPDSDSGDGQGFWNDTRTKAATELTDWLADDPTGSGDTDFLILGDLNAYALEDPIDALLAAGYENLFAETTAYSYVFDGQWGSLDHALVSDALSDQVTGAAKWHINADEPRALDYNTEFKSPDQIDDFYAADQYRTSDHDPIIVGLDLYSENMITVIEGKPGRDRLVGTDADELFDGNGGSDVILTGDGYDIVNLMDNYRNGQREVVLIADFNPDKDKLDGISSDNVTRAVSYGDRTLAYLDDGDMLQLVGVRTISAVDFVSSDAVV